MRHEFSAKTKLIIFERAAGHCEGCGRKCFPGDFNYDHTNPDGLGGAAIAENGQLLCKSCHTVKTKTDITRIAKAKRIRRKSVGIKKASTMAGARTSPWKKTFAHGWVKR